MVFVHGNESVPLHIYGGIIVRWWWIWCGGREGWWKQQYSPILMNYGCMLGLETESSYSGGGYGVEEEKDGGNNSILQCR